MPSLAFRKASICSRFSFSASCTLVVNPQHATRSRLILYWKLPPPSGSSCIGKDFTLQKIAGHANISTTMRYVHPQREAIEDAFASRREHLRWPPVGHVHTEIGRAHV